MYDIDKHYAVGWKNFRLMMTRTRFCWYVQDCIELPEGLLGDFDKWVRLQYGR